ncbi:threonine dehydrogenase-like Zn-dependent dehydrogenase [Halarchaeum rubridurum]|uniref:L-threonine 3-dehydrogenase n=1 Tax=Halarchaeum rubridurum TaxID=489911 RepID=A0A830FY73_9EURY|nr:alcohol dehydrogenase catalytic domain-containing protein [Halarchaeum rubridurum]MBP1954782.1 threonine dehydrogenase-like Zn-dependent dehydrogenase [Halarchaeum rubridurum]GGM59709.1 L-threonine 3-dehydrogenase [Halarchaeum rubridurum]
MTDTSMTVLEKHAAEPGMRLAERPVPTPGADEVRIAVRSVGIDGGVEAPFYRWDDYYHRYEPHLPQVFGHEFAGVVDAVGSDVVDWAGGERVAVEPRYSCGRCRNCREGRQNLCTEEPGFSPHGRKAVGIDVDTPGALAEYVVVPARNLYELPAGVTFDEGVFLELLAIGVHAIEASAFEVGDRVAITGPGSAGLSALLAAREAGASEIVIVGADADEGTRLPIAAEMGATATRNASEGALNRPVDVFVEASGHESALRLAEASTRPGGEIAQVGVFHDERVPVGLTGLLNEEVSIETVNGRRQSDWRRTLALAADLDLSRVVGPAFDMADYEAGFAAEAERAGVKVVLNP